MNEKYVFMYLMILFGYHVIESRKECEDCMELTTTVETDNEESRSRGGRKKKTFPGFISHSKCIAVLPEYICTTVTQFTVSYLLT